MKCELDFVGEREMGVGAITVKEEGGTSGRGLGGRGEVGASKVFC